ncbi:RDD family protein [Archangium sp.]|jgi:uncharacterized RDD family membrane protein YckC|uniref:RDD family protein n=1 Tax=Archangium sp. TaxID=1872627 RepID=UPI002EDAAA0E
MHLPDPSTQLQGARCAEHLERPASVICTRCGSYACNLCRNEGPDGLEYCGNCIASVSTVLAEPGSRFVAQLVDSFAVMLPLVGLGIFAAIAAPSISDPTRRGTVVGVALLLGAAGMLCVVGYQLYLLSQIGQTIGKRMMGIKVVRTDGSPVDLGRLILLRNLVPQTINAFCGLFSIVDALFIFGAERRTLHDQIADTKVVKVDVHAG